MKTFASVNLALSTQVMGVANMDWSVAGWVLRYIFYLSYYSYIFTDFFFKGIYKATNSFLKWSKMGTALTAAFLLLFWSGKGFCIFTVLPLVSSFFNTAGFTTKWKGAKKQKRYYWQLNFLHFLFWVTAESSVTNHNVPRTGCLAQTGKSSSLLTKLQNCRQWLAIIGYICLLKEYFLIFVPGYL